MGRVVADSATAEHDAARGPQFALAKFSPPALPDTLVVRSRLHDRLTAGAGRRLTSVVGSAGAGKSVLMADWAAARPPGLTAWLSGDSADADPLRFWVGFIAAPRTIEPAFGRDAAGLLAMDRQMSADVIASIANDAAKLPAGSAIIVDDFHIAAPVVARDMTDLVECWPAETTQLVLAGRFDPALRLHRLRISAELCEVRDRDLIFLPGQQLRSAGEIRRPALRCRPRGASSAKRGVARGPANGRAVAARHHRSGPCGAGAAGPQPGDRRLLHR